MSIFGRKKEEDYEDEDQESEEFEVRDFKKENKKRRKEPPRPWGKRERYTVLVFLLATVLISGVLAASSRNWKLPGFPQIKFSGVPKVSFDFLRGETITIGPGKNEVDARLLTKAEKIKIGFQTRTRSLSGTYAFFVTDLESGFSFGKNENEVMTAASLIKLPVIALIFIESEEERISLDEKPEGSNFTFRQLAEEMGKKSNNSAQAIVANFFGREKIQSVIDSLGMEDTSYIENETTAYDVGLLLQKIWSKEIISENSRDEIMDYLTNTIYEDWIKKGIPEVRVAHKYGREVHVISDAGVVFAEHPFILVVMTEGIVEAEANAFIPEFSGLVFKEM